MFRFSCSLSTFKVRVGEWNAANLNEPIPAEDIGIVNVFIHPNFNSANLQNDVAILQLAKTISLNDKSTVGTICLPDANMVNNRQLCYVAGWGKDAFGATGAYQAIQRKVDLRLVTNGVCQASLRRTRLGSAFQLDGNSFLCAGGENGKDACTVRRKRFFPYPLSTLFFNLQSSTFSLQIILKCFLLFFFSLLFL